MNEKLVKKGKHLAFLLRHDKEALEDGRIDSQGWRKLSELKNLGYTTDEIETIVREDNKGRYEFSNDGRSIRARQGHSINVDVGLKEATPPDTLFHGTAMRFIESIYKEGLKPQSRLYVHLSKDRETAYNVGIRHGSPYIFEIDTKQMVEDGKKFFLSNNGVWLTDYVNPKYFKK